MFLFIVLGNIKSVKLIFSDLPFKKISWKRLLSEIPVLVKDRRHFHCVLSWKDRYLKHSTSIDEDLTCQGIYIQSITEVRMQELMYWVEDAQSSICRDNKWLNCCMGVQPASQSYAFRYTNQNLPILWEFCKTELHIPVANELMIARIIYRSISFGQLPNRTLDAMFCRSEDLAGGTVCVPLWMR